MFGARKPNIEILFKSFSMNELKKELHIRYYDVAEDLAWDKETRREAKRPMRATGSLYFTKARYQFYGVIKVQNKTTITIAGTRTNIYLSSVRKVRKNN